MTFPVAGAGLGHCTRDGTGVSVLLLPDGTVGAGEVRGGAPATRETALLEPGRTVDRVDAVVFTGGSAYGLAAADGVMRFLAERGQGFPTAGGPVPIVPAAAIFDLAENGGARPTAEDGYAAAVVAGRGEQFARGRVGAGTGASIGKWRGREHRAQGGFGLAWHRGGGVTLAAIAVVNAVGDVRAADGSVLVGSSAPPDAVAFPVPEAFQDTGDRGSEAGANTTLVAVVTDASFDKAACHLLAQSAHDGLSRALHPPHTRFDGDFAIACATGTAEGHLDRMRAVAVDVVADAVRDAVRPGAVPPAAR